MHGLKEIQFDVGSPAGVLKADISTKSHLSSAPLVRDPYEATMIDVKKSTIEKAGDGVFLEGIYVMIFHFFGPRFSMTFQIWIRDSIVTQNHDDVYFRLAIIVGNCHRKTRP